MVEAKQGKIDVDYFKNMIQSREETEHKGALSGRGDMIIKLSTFLDGF